MLLDDLSSNDHDLQLHSIAHGVITLEQLSLDYGAERRRLRVVKMRGMKYRGGYHDFTIETGGLAIYPRLVAAEHHKAFLGELTSTGSFELDALLGGGIERGTSMLLIGGAGVGKSSIALTCAMAAAARGETGRRVRLRRGTGHGFRAGRRASACRCRRMSTPVKSGFSRSTRPRCRPANLPIWSDIASSTRVFASSSSTA